MDCPLALEGAFLVERALDAGLRLEALYCVPARESWARDIALRAQGSGVALEPRVLPEAAISEIAGYPFHRGAYALARRPPAQTVAEAIPGGSDPSTLLVLPELGDPENLGAAFRNAAALGCSALLLGPGGPDPLCRRALRVSMGSSLVLPWARMAGPEAFAELAAKGFRAAACVLDPGAPDLRSWERPDRLALVLGNEAFGLSPPWLDACQERITLKMLGRADSLNLATAAAVFLYALSPESGG
jgi:tRNA G18 (ribose-2'-O)-methylase SpoU